MLEHEWVVSRGGRLPRPLGQDVVHGAATVATVRRLKNLCHGVLALNRCGPARHGRRTSAVAGGPRAGVGSATARGPLGAAAFLFRGCLSQYLCLLLWVRYVRAGRHKWPRLASGRRQGRPTTRGKSMCAGCATCRSECWRWAAVLGSCWGLAEPMAACGRHCVLGKQIGKERLGDEGSLLGGSGMEDWRMCLGKRG